MKHPSVILAGIALLCAAGLSQSQAELPQFEAASIRVNESADRASTRYDAARVELHKASIKHMVRRGYPLPDYQVVWPGWVGGPGPLGYDVSVTFPAGTTPERVELMFQDLLATRFGMKMHWEMREVRAFEVRASEGGPKLHQALNPAPPTDYPKYTTRLEREKGVWHFSSQLAGAPSGLTVGGILEALNATRILDRPLIDATGIQGFYDAELSVPVDIAENRPSVSELLGSLEKQLGLKATLKTLSLRTLVVDHLERIPTEN